MKEIKNINMELDPQLQTMFMAYVVIPERDVYAAQRTRTRFLTELNKSFTAPTVLSAPVSLTAASVWPTSLMWLRSNLILLIRQRVIAYTFFALMICGVFLFGGVGMSVYAASLSLPGDAMYPLKTGLENVGVSLSLDSEDDARLYLDYAGRRLTEMRSLVDRERYDDIAVAADEFEKDVQKALEAIERLSQTDPGRAVALHAEIKIILQGYSDILLQIFVNLPDEVKPVIHDVLIIVLIVVDDDDHYSDDDYGDDREGKRGILTPTTEATVTPTLSPPPTATVVVPTATSIPSGPSIPGGNGSNGDDGDDDDDDDDD